DNSNDPVVLEDAGPQTIAGLATNISAGAANETGQALTFVVTANSNPALFSSAPSVAGDGTLTFTPAPDAFGTAVVTIVLRDDGGTADGGVDTSAPQSFTITVEPVDDAPVAADDGYETAEDTALVITARGVLANDTDVDDPSTVLVALSIVAPQHGLLTLNT